VRLFSRKNCFGADEQSRAEWSVYVWVSRQLLFYSYHSCWFCSSDNRRDGVHIRMQCCSFWCRLFLFEIAPSGICTGAF